MNPHAKNNVVMEAKAARSLAAVRVTAKTASGALRKILVQSPGPALPAPAEGCEHTLPTDLPAPSARPGGGRNAPGTAPDIDLRIDPAAGEVHDGDVPRRPVGRVRLAAVTAECDAPGTLADPGEGARDLARLGVDLEHRPVAPRGHVQVVTVG